MLAEKKSNEVYGHCINLDENVKSKFIIELS